MRAALKLTPEIVHLQRQRSALTNRLRWLSPNARRHHALHVRQVEITRRILELEVALRAADEAPRQQERLPSEPQLPLVVAIDEGEELKWFQK